MKITKAEDYAISLMAELAINPKKFHSLNHIAEKRSLPEPFLKKIAHQLKNAGLIAVKEGRTGGYRLAKPPQKISLEEILKIFNPRPFLTACILKNPAVKCLKYNTCSSRKTWGIISRSFYKNIRKINLSQLIQK